MIKYAFSSELTRVLQRLVKEAGIETGNKVVRFHGLRKFLIDRLSDVMSESKWKQIVGKTISEGAYISAERLREDYERAMKETTYRQPISESEIELRSAQRMLEMTLNIATNIPEDVKKTLLKKIRASKKLQELKPIESEVAEASKNNANANNCPDGEHCQRIVNEADLSGMLAQGWRVAAVLPSGKIVVSNE
jgi:vacuolar-type H+-ATPase catalytic subunit A/Vma1